MRWILCGGLLAMAACAAGTELGLDDNAVLATSDAGPPGNDARNTTPASPSRDAGASSTSSSGGSSSKQNTSSSSGQSTSSSSGSSSSGSSSGELIDTGVTLDVPAGGVLRAIESCWAVGTEVETLELGAPLVLDYPAAWHVERLLDTAPENVPGVQVGLGAAGRARMLVPMDTPIEWFLGFAVVVMQQADYTASTRSCYFDVLAPGWQHARTTHWLESSSTTVDKDLGIVSRAGGVVVEGYFQGSPTYRVNLVPGTGDVLPIRTTIFDEYGLGAHVFKNLTPGAHSFYLHRVSSNTLFHVHFTVTP